MSTNYEQIKGQMNLWRMGAIGFPQSYIDYHKDLAMKDVEATLKPSLTVHRTYVAADSWMDGMKVVYAIVEDSKGNLSKLKWHDSGDRGCWFECSSSGGAFPYRGKTQSVG